MIRPVQLVPNFCNHLSAYSEQIYAAFSALLVTHANKIGDHANVENQSDDTSGTVLNDPVASETRYQCLGTRSIGPCFCCRFNCTNSCAQSACRNLFNILRWRNLCGLSTNLLVQFNSSSMHTIHRFIPEGIRSYPGTVSLIELLVQIVDQVRQRWIHASESGGIGALFGDDHGLLALTQAVSTSMVSFIKVYVDPMCPANDPLCPSLAQALLSGRGMSCIINILISYIRLF